MTIIYIIIGVIVILFLPAIVFKFINPKKLGEKIDRATEKMQAKTKTMKAKRKQN